MFKLGLRIPLFVAALGLAFSVMPTSVQAWVPSPPPVAIVLKKQATQVNPHRFSWQLTLEPRMVIQNGVEPLPPVRPVRPIIVEARYHLHFRSIDGTWEHHRTVDWKQTSIRRTDIPFPGSGKYEWQVTLEATIRVGGQTWTFTIPADDGQYGKFEIRMPRDIVRTTSP